MVRSKSFAGDNYKNEKGLFIVHLNKNVIVTIF